ncbi:MAG: alanine racemase [Nitrospirae bacterium]|nr:alanine racemase [Nitrospirota bacterium]
MELQKAYAEIDLSALSHNLNVVRKKTGDLGIIAVIKANAYGHGAVEVAGHVTKKGVSKLGVAYTNEAITLRDAGITTPILVFFDRDHFEACFKYDLTPTVYDLDTAKKLSAEAFRLNRQISVHIKVDTGMGRLGFDIRKAPAEIVKIASMKNIKIEGLMSHFSEADLQDKAFADLQLKRFRSLVTDLKQKNIRFRFLHMANSAAVLTMPEAHLNMVRPGIMLYGYGCCEKEKLRPVMSLKSRPILLKKVPAGTPISYSRTFVTKRKSTIATIPVGYADGYNRKLSNQGEVLINGRRAPVAGRVCMDTIMVDVTDIPDVNYKTEVVLMGHQGRERITADDIANKTGTIPYEVLTSIGQRIKRIYRQRY